MANSQIDRQGAEAKRRGYLEGPSIIWRLRKGEKVKFPWRGVVHDLKSLQERNALYRETFGCCCQFRIGIDKRKAMGVAGIVAIAGFGGFMLNMMNLWDDARRQKSERIPKDILYWVFFVAWPLIGAALAYIYLLDGSNLRPLLAFSVGLGAPTTIKSLMATAAQPAGPPANAEP